MTEKSTLMALRRMSPRQARENSCGSMSGNSSRSRFMNLDAFVAKSRLPTNPNLTWLRAARLRAQSRISYSIRSARLIMEGEYLAFSGSCPHGLRLRSTFPSERFLLGASFCKHRFSCGEQDPVFLGMRTIANVSEGFERAQLFVGRRCRG